MVQRDVDIAGLSGPLGAAVKRRLATNIQSRQSKLESGFRAFGRFDSSLAGSGQRRAGLGVGPIERRIKLLFTKSSSIRSMLDCDLHKSNHYHISVCAKGMELAVGRQSLEMFWT